MSTITLSCLVVGENPYENAFNVKVNKTEVVSELRKAIKEEIDDNVKAKDLKLWKVDISLEEENEKLKLVNTKINVNIKEELGGVELLPLSKISKHFPSQPANEHIHIIVQRPVETKEVHCTAMYGQCWYGTMSKENFNVLDMSRPSVPSKYPIIFRYNKGFKLTYLHQY